MQIKEFHDAEKTGTLSYIVYDEQTLDSVVIDPVLNYDLGSNQISSESFELLVNFIKEHNLNVHYILETHVHADHLSSSQKLKVKFPNAKTAINKNISLVQKTFKKELNLNDNFNTEGQQFDLLLNEGQILKAGSLSIEVLFTPGHTPACSSFLIEKNIFSGDAIFMPDLGTGRCDFPGGSAEQLYNSISNKIYNYPDDYTIYPGHDYPPEGRGLHFKALVGKQKTQNIHLKSDTTKENFIEFRTNRDKTLNPPKFIEPSLKVNLNGGKTDYL